MIKNTPPRNDLQAALLVIILILISISMTNQLKAQSPIIGVQVFIEPGQSKQDVETWFKLLADHNMPVCRIVNV